MRDGGLKVILLAVDKQGQVAKWEEIQQRDFPDLDEFIKAVGKKRVELRKLYPKESYTIHEGMADSVETLVKAYPELTYASQ